MKRERILSRWSLVMAGDQGPILAGCEGMEIRRTSTPLVEFDPETLTGVTASGRPYCLLGEPEPSYAVSAFLSLWDPGDAEVRVVTPEEAVELIREKGNKPFEHAPEEQEELDQKKLQHVSGQFRMSALGMDDDEAARRSGLTADQLQGLLDGDLKHISADEADAAFVRLVAPAYGWVRDGVIVPDPEPGDLDHVPDFGVTSEIRATTVLSIIDTIRQRGLSIEEAADLADVDVDIMRGLMERRDSSMLDIDALGSVMTALEAVPGRKQ